MLADRCCLLSGYSVEQSSEHVQHVHKTCALMIHRLVWSPQVRTEVARQLREARSAAGESAETRIELYETDPRKANAMPLSARCAE